LLAISQTIVGIIRPAWKAARDRPAGCHRKRITIRPATGLTVLFDNRAPAN